MSRVRAETARSAAAIPMAAALLAFLGPGDAWAANPSLATDFKAMSQWLSDEVVQGLAFSAGSTMDPPREVTSRRLQPDLSVGLGRMPLDKSKFPKLTVNELNEMGAQQIFPDKVTFPNLIMHMRAGLPFRSDFALRFANMTTPPGYKLGPDTPASGQSNSFGLTLRRHFLGHDGMPLLTVGANYNHIFGRFDLASKFGVDESDLGFVGDVDLNGHIQWDIRSIGVNTVVSQTYGRWTPFAGFGVNRAQGSMRVRLEGLAQTPTISPIIAEASSTPELMSGRAIVGFQVNRSWANFFANGEIKSLGIRSGAMWTMHAGMTLPFSIGPKRSFLAKKGARAAERNAAQARVERERRRELDRERHQEIRYRRVDDRAEPVIEGAGGLMFIQ